MAAVNSTSFILSGKEEPARLTGAGVSSNFFSLLGVRFALGRNFLPEEDRPGQNRVVDSEPPGVAGAVRRATREIAGSTITLNDNIYTVAGVLPAEFSIREVTRRISRRAAK